MLLCLPQVVVQGFISWEMLCVFEAKGSCENFGVIYIDRYVVCLCKTIIIFDVHEEEKKSNDCCVFQS